MSGMRIQVIDQYSSPLFNTEFPFLSPQTLSLYDPRCYLCPTLDLFEPFTDLVRIPYTTPFYSRSCIIGNLSDRVSSLELGLDCLINESRGRDRKYTWTEEIKGVDRDVKYTWTAEINGGIKHSQIQAPKRNYKWTKKIKGEGRDRKYKWTSEIKGSNDQKCTFKSSIVDKKDIKKNKTRAIEVEGPSDREVYVLKQAFAKRAGAHRLKGKKKVLSPQDAALMIQGTFRAYLIRRSQSLRALRNLAVAKTKLKEIRVLYNNFNYHNRVACDAEERQRFSERIIVLLLTIDAIDGVDVMVRSAKRSMEEELEVMLDVLDPHPKGRFPLTKRRTFDMPNGVAHEEIVPDIVKAVELINYNENSDAC